VWRLARPVVSRLTAMAPKLGGLLLVLAVVIWGGKVATDAALGTGLFRSPWTWAAVTLAFASVYLFVGITFPTLHRIYRKRLRRTFGLARRGGTVYAPDEPDQLSWDRMPPDAPELVLCCAQQRTGIAPGGLPAETFTISRRHVRMGDTVVATSQYLERLHPDLATERYVSSWIATTGAAFASAMGRLSKGSTNALLAALNVDLGIWLPNPRLVADPSVRFAKVRFGYLFKEILGWYDPLDRYVFVADGGHWENLGLVELLRRRCGLIVCFDAAGDTGGTFTTLMQAVELAGLELPDVVGSIDVTELERLRGKGGAMPGGVLATLRVTYRNPDGTTSTGTILFAKAQLAGNLDIALRRFAKADPRFPDYSTGDQFLSDAQFAALVDLGRAAGTAVVDELATLPPP
nr:hypothetical protein [Acidimicrobiia bacterium]